jgi:MFS family permease
MFLLGAILPVVMILVVFFVMPESPRWLVAKGRETDALIVLQQIYPEGYNVDPILADIKEAIQRDTASSLAVSWSFLCQPSPAVRRMLLVGVGIAVAQQAVGIDAIQYYLIDVISESGIESREGQSLVLILLGGLKLIFIVVGGKCFDIVGRRFLLFLSLAGMTASLLLISLAFLIDNSLSTKAIVTGLALYLSFFSVGMGPGAWLIPSEVFATVIRAKAMSIATLLNRAVASLMAGTFLSTTDALGWSGFFFLLAVVCVLVLAFLWLYLPETKGRSLEEMSVYFAESTGDNMVLQVEAELVQRRRGSTPAGGVGAASGAELI